MIGGIRLKQTHRWLGIALICLGLAVNTPQANGAEAVPRDAEAPLFVISQYDLKGYIDSSGKVVIAARYDEVRDFYEGFAAVLVGAHTDAEGKVTGGKWGFIDQTGKMMIPARFDEVSNFINGLAGFRVGATLADDGTLEGGKWGFIDRNGKYVAEPRYSDVYFNDEFIQVKLLTENAAGNPVEKWGMIDYSGKLVIPVAMDRVSDFAEGLAAVSMGGKPNEEGVMVGS